MRKKPALKKRGKKKRSTLSWGIGLTLGIVLIVILVNSSSTQIKDKSTGKTLELVRNKQHYQFLTFEQLLFPNEYLHAANASYLKNPFQNHLASRKGDPIDKPKSQINIPDRIKALDGKKIALEGYAVPLESDGKNLKSFLLVDQIVDCLFCQGLGISQWVVVTVMNPDGIRVAGAQYENPITVYGTLEVGDQYKDGHLDSIYRMKPDGIEHKNFFFDASF